MNWFSAENKWSSMLIFTIAIDYPNFGNYSENYKVIKYSLI